MKEDITLEEVNGHAIDVVFAGVDTVRKLEETKYSRTSTNGHLYERPLQDGCHLPLSTGN